MNVFFFLLFTVSVHCIIDSNTTVEYNSTTTSTVASTITSETKSASNFNKKFSSLDEIKKLLKIDSIKRCAYDSNPNVVALCPHYSELLAKELNIDYKNSSSEEEVIDSAYFLRLDDIEKVIINESIVKQLNDKCGSKSEWCLNATSSAEIDMASELMANYGSSLCLVSTCYDEMRDYIMNCAQSELTKYLFNLLPLLCKVYLENKSKDYCLQDTLKMLHVTYAMSKRVGNASNSDFNVCNDACSDDCRRFSKQLNRLESCCERIDLVKDFKAFNWYFDNKNQIISSCNLPIKTICLNEGKFYVEVNQPLMYIFVASMFAFFLLVTFIFWVCRRNGSASTVRVSSLDNADYQYSQLNNNNNSGNYDELDDDYFDEDAFHRKFSLTNYSLTDHQNSVEIKNLIAKH